MLRAQAVVGSRHPGRSLAPRAWDIMQCRARDGLADMGWGQSCWSLVVEVKTAYMDSTCVVGEIVGSN